MALLGCEIHHTRMLTAVYLCVAFALQSDGRDKQFGALGIAPTGSLELVSPGLVTSVKSNRFGITRVMPLPALHHRYRVIDARHLAHRRDLRLSNTLVLLGGLGDAGLPSLSSLGSVREIQ